MSSKNRAHSRPPYNLNREVSVNEGDSVAVYTLYQRQEHDLRHEYTAISYDYQFLRYIEQTWSI